MYDKVNQINYKIFKNDRIRSAVRIKYKLLLLKTKNIQLHKKSQHHNCFFLFYSRRVPLNA